jgi:hypothetical protein
MPLPPIPLASWLSHTADQWRKRQQTQLDQLRETASAWDLHAQSAVHGIGDTFSGLGTRVQEALPDLPPPPPMPTPQLELPQPVQDLGASVGGAFSDLGSGIQSGVQGAREAIQAVAPPAPDWSQQAQAAVDSIGSAAGGAADALANAPSLSPMGLGANLGASLGAGQATPTISTLHDLGQTVRTNVIEPGLAVQAASRAGERADYGNFVDRMYGATPGGAPVGADRERLLDYLQLNADVGSSVAGSTLRDVTQGAARAAAPAAAAAEAVPGLVDDLAARAPRFGERVGGALTGSLDTAGAALDDAMLGIRRGQRGVRAPRLSPEQAAQRAADGAAEQRVFDAIQRLWRQGPEGEALADDLRFLAVGKGEEGEAAARSLLARKGLGELLPPGVIPDATAGAEGLLGAATRATDPFLARGALTGGERAFDIGAGTAGGVLGAATADEDATWQERAGRAALGASLGALGGANARQLARRLGAGALDADVLGAVAGQSGGRVRAPTAAEAADVLSSGPLTAPPSLTANALSGASRTVERLANELAELRPIDAAIDAWTTGRAAVSPSTWRKAGQAFGSGPTPRNPGPTGAASPEGLASAPGRLAQALTAGTRGNSATDEVVRTANEAGARAVGLRRGLSGQDLEDFVTQAGDYATITGPNSPVANAVNKAKSWVSDPDATPAMRATGWVATALSPYVSMTERALAATLGAVSAPARVPLQQAAKRVLPSNAFTDALTGTKLTPRQMMGQMAVGLTLDWKLAQLASGQVEGVRIYGPPPEDAGLKRDMERQGARWESLVVGTPGSPDVRVTPLRNFGTVGQAGSLIASLVTAGGAADRGGKVGGEKAEKLVDELAAWTLDQSFLSDYADLAEATNERRFSRAAARTVVGVPGRLASLVAGPVNAADPLERDTNSMAGALASAVPGGRYALPEKIDPTTGEGLRRAGSGLSRYWGERGTVQTPEAQELARHGLSAREIRDGKFAGEAQTVDAVRKLKQAYGAETGRAVREVQKSPAYQKATDPEKKKLLEKALRDADFEAELRVGDGVKRSAKAQAAWEYSATAKYAGAPKDGDANTIRRYNRSVSQARAARTEARKTDPKNPDRAEAAWARANPEEAKLARRASVSATVLRKKKAEIYGKHKVSP